MRICILGSYSGLRDEGMANISYSLYENMKSVFPDVWLLDVQQATTFDFWRKIFRLKPDIVHYVPGPTLKGLMLTKLVSIIARCKSVISATKPVLPKHFGMIAGLLKPSIIIAQSKKSEEMFRAFGYKTVFIPNGVDIDRFVPISGSHEKERLRKQYNLSQNDFIVLHVGPVRHGRNQEMLLQLQGVKVLLVASITNPSEEALYQQLTDRVIVWKKYFPQIQEIYALSDVYVFPVFEELNSIEIPLSVLEAMACNLPVITTKYGGLEMILPEGDGLFFIDRPELASDIIDRIKKGYEKIDTRRKVERLSWRSIIKDISGLYQQILSESS